MSSNTDDDDGALMARVVKGDTVAFRILADRHVGLISRLARRMLRSVAESEDVAQEALLRVWTHAAQWQPDRSRLTTWIYTVVYRLCIDRLRARRHVSLDTAPDVVDPAATVFDIMVQQADHRRLTAALSTLNSRQYAALILFYYEELSGPEAAEVLGLGLRAFWSLLHRARETVQQHMAKSDD
jgi:RNA polymerase sigma-70 factor (ECF subfamily)